AVLMYCAVWLTSADAAEWHTNGPLTSTSTDGGSMRFVIHPHTSGTTLAVGCSSSYMHMALNGPTSTAMPWTNAATVTPLFSGCQGAGGAGFIVRCAPAELRASSYVGGTTFATAGGGITTGSVTNIDCRVSIGATDCVTITGTVPAHYTNPNPIASGAGRLTITATGQALTADRINTCVLIPPGFVTWGTPGSTATTITDFTYVYDGPGAPYIYRTP
ncbi:MAG: hypothetical protein ABUL56_02755, partial [Actinomycetota bacterium]